MDTAHNLIVLQHAWSDCRGCNLHQERKNIVFGGGYPRAQILVVGEAPGKNEDEEGQPFVGQAGRLLDQYLASVSVIPEVVKMCDTGEWDFPYLRNCLKLGRQG